MKLIEVLQLIEGNNRLPLVMDDDGIDSRPDSSFKVTLCFMCEEETWLTCSTYSEVLIPWYDCEITSINPNYDDSNSICVWLKDEDYIRKNFKHCVIVKEGEE